MDLNKKLVELFLESEMNQKEFAEKTQQSYSSLNHWLNLESNLTFRKLKDIAEKLGKK